jgi:hypothetical protein
MTRASNISELRAFKQRLSDHFIVLRRTDAIELAADVQRRLESNKDDFSTAYSVVACCSSLEVFVRALIVEIFDDYYFALSEDAIEKKRRFSEVKVPVSQFIGTSKNTLTLILSLSCKISSFKDCFWVVPRFA